MRLRIRAMSNSASGEWKSIRTSQFAIRDGTKELKRKMQVVVPAFSSSPSYEKDSEAKRRQTQGSSAVPTGTAAPQKREAHIYRRSTAALVPRSLSSQGTQHQAVSSWDVAERLVAPPSSGRYPPLPVPVQRGHRSLVVVPGG